MNNHEKNYSYFIKHTALFGGYPNQEQVNRLEEIGVKVFVDLTCPGETKIIPYKTQQNYIRYPIMDHKVPNDWISFSTLILKICHIIHKLKDKEKIYIHCKGGHGRSGLVVACILCHLTKKTPNEALFLTNYYHSMRKNMKEKRRRQGSPPGEYQKNFVRRFFQPLYIHDVNCTYSTIGFSNYSLHSIDIPGLGSFHSSEAAYQAHKDPNNIAYIKMLEKTLDPKHAHDLGQKCNLPADWNKNKSMIMYRVLCYKFNQNRNIRKNLLNTGLRPIIYHSPDKFWGNGYGHRYNRKHGKNMLGVLLSQERNRLFLKRI